MLVTRCTVAGFKLADDGVKIVTQLDSSGRPLNSGLAYVRFDSAAEAQRAAAVQHRKTMGNRYIECLPVSPTQRMVRPLPDVGAAAAAFSGLDCADIQYHGVPSRALAGPKLSCCSSSCVVHAVDRHLSSRGPIGILHSIVGCGAPSEGALNGCSQPPRLPMTMPLSGYGLMPEYGRPERVMGTGARPAYIQAGPTSCYGTRALHQLMHASTGSDVMAHKLFVVVLHSCSFVQLMYAGHGSAGREAAAWAESTSIRVGSVLHIHPAATAPATAPAALLHATAAVHNAAGAIVSP